MNEKEKKKALITFGQGIRKARTLKKISQEELAALADIDRSYLGAVERGEHNLALLNILKIADALDVHPKTLFDGYLQPTSKGK